MIGHVHMYMYILTSGQRNDILFEICGFLSWQAAKACTG